MASEIAAAKADSRNDTVVSAEDICKDELNRYKNIASLPLCCRELGSLVFNDPLHWWKEMQGQFPILAGLARKFWAVQATLVPSERVFSVASRIISNRRARLDSTTTAGMLFYLSNLGLI
jgi:hAT family C-terminal dimerisation region